MNNEPVAWWTGKFEDECDEFIFNETRQSHMQSLYSKYHNAFPIPLYTHPAKTLTAEEINQVAKDCKWDYDEMNVIDFARAILRKAQEK